MGRLLFRESQKITQWWVWAILALTNLGVIILFSFGFYTQFVEGVPWGDEPMSDVGLAVVGVGTISLMLGISYMVLNVELITEIRNEAVYFRMPPVINRFRKYDKSKIDRYEISKYNSMRSYGGFGIRHGFSGNAYNIKGNMGLRIHLKGKKRHILIGTQKPDELRKAMQELFNPEERDY